MKHKLSIVHCQLSILLIVAFFASPLKAQVKIGDVTNPQSYSILEIDTTQYKGGVRMPQLTTLQRDSLSANVFPLDGNQDAARGLVIFNTDTKCIEYWNNSEWISLCNDIAVITLAQPGNIAGATSVCPSGMTQTYSIDEVPGATSYTWTLPDGWTGYSTTNSITVTPALPLGITNTVDGTGTSVGGTIQVTANNTSGSSPASTLVVATYNGCCAYISDTDWRAFACYNLGAVQNGQPFNPSIDLIGDYYQWGSKTPAAYGPSNGDAYVYNNTWSSTPPATVWGTTDAAYTKNPDTDPCPDGYRIPSSDEWNGVVSYNTWTSKGSWSDDLSGNSGYMFGNALFLPAAGWRSNGTGELYVRGYYGQYWCSRLYDSTNAYTLTLTYYTTGLSYGSGFYRANGDNIRCIAE